MLSSALIKKLPAIIFGCTSLFYSPGSLFINCVVSSLITGDFDCSVVFSLFFMLNLILWGEGSSAAVPFTTLVAILALWFGVSVPLTFVGAFLGFRKRVCTFAKLIRAHL
jgi:hypothetical protein